MSKYVFGKYQEFISKNGYVPKMFNPYNCTEILDIAPTLSTYCGSTTSSATVLIMEENMNNEIDELLKGTNYARNFGSKGKVQDLDGICDTLQAAMGSGGGNVPIVKESFMNALRIRKLTPKETWRLMGFDDADFEKAEKVNSNTQLYKQAGNSIVVDVLENLLGSLVEVGVL